MRFPPTCHGQSRSVQRPWVIRHCPRSVFAAHTHLGGRVLRPLVLFLHPRVGTHELIHLLLLFFSFRSLNRTWGGGASIPSPRCAAPQSGPYGCLSRVFSSQFFFAFSSAPYPFSPISIFAFLLLTPDFSGLYYFVVFEKERERG